VGARTTHADVLVLQYTGEVAAVVWIGIQGCGRQ
jgi:hypothetical protein